MKTNYLTMREQSFLCYILKHAALSLEILFDIKIDDSVSPELSEHILSLLNMRFNIYKFLEVQDPFLTKTEDLALTVMEFRKIKGYSQ